MMRTRLRPLGTSWRSRDVVRPGVRIWKAKLPVALDEDGPVAGFVKAIF